MSSLYIIDIYPSSDRLFSLFLKQPFKAQTFYIFIVNDSVFFPLVCGLDALAKKFLPISTNMVFCSFLFKGWELNPGP